MAHITEAHTASRGGKLLTHGTPASALHYQAAAWHRCAPSSPHQLFRGQKQRTTNMNLHKPEVLDVMSPFFSTGRAERGFESQTDLVKLRAFGAECFCRSSVFSKQGRVGRRQGLIFGFFVGWL